MSWFARKIAGRAGRSTTAHEVRLVKYGFRGRALGTSILLMAAACKAGTSPPHIILAVDEASQFGRTDQKITLASASKMTTAELARLLQPNEPTDRFVSHELIRHGFPGHPLGGVLLFARPVPFGNDLCRRDSVYVGLDPVLESDSSPSRPDVPMKFASADNKVQLVAAPQCRLKAGSFFAWVQPERALDGATRNLRRLLSLQKAAQAGAPLAAEVVCRFEPPAEEACTRPPRVLLASLPLDRIFIVDPRREGWEFSVMPDGPGEGKLFWEVILTPEQAGEQKVTLGWRVVAPF